MIKAAMAIIVTILLLLSTGPAIGADFAKEGSGDYRSGKSGTFTFIAMGQEQGRMNVDEMGAVVFAPENSPFHNASFRSIGSSHIIKGKWKAAGMVEFNCTNGDKIYGTYDAQGMWGGPSSSLITFIGGTGSCTGIEGTLEIKGTPGIKEAKEGTYQGISVGTVNWKIP